MRPVAFTGHNEISLLHRGAEYFPALIAAFDAARFEILLEVYIFAADPTADQVRAALERAAGRGVVVKVMADWVGTGRAQANFLRDVFLKAGVTYRAFNPWFRRGLARNHRKLCVVDRKQAFMGGLNINDDLLSDDGFLNVLPAPRWDFALQIAGPLVAVIHRTMQAHWDNVANATLKARWQHFKERRAMLNSGADAPMLAALVLRDNLRNRRTIQRSYLHALGHAKKSVLLVSAYFAPGRKLRVALSSAAKRGVDVTLLLDVGQYKLQDAVAHSFYPQLLKSGVKIVEYRKTQLHGKVAVVDDDWATVGSSNHDGLSLFVNQEANVIIKDAKFARALRLHIQQGLADGVPVDRDEFANIPWYERLWYGTAYLFYKNILHLFTWGRSAE